MDPFFINAEGEVTPSIVLDSSKNIFEIKGWSHPEDAPAFYTPVFSWLDEYAKSPNSHTDFHFNFHYFNTSSAKQIFRVISSLEGISSVSKVTIHWHYDKEDDDMLTTGERLSKMSTVPFKFIAN